MMWFYLSDDSYEKQISEKLLLISGERLMIRRGKNSRKADFSP